MSTVVKIQKALQKVVKLAKSKKFQNFLILLLMFNSLMHSVQLDQTFAQEGEEESTKFDCIGLYEESGKGKAAIAGEGVDAQLNKTNLTASTLCDTLTAMIGTDAFEPVDTQAAAKVSPATRYGLVGTAQANVNALLYNPPTQNVYDHLAQEWVPGYRDANSAVYAQDGYTVLVGSGVADLWERVRQLAYVLFVVVLIVAGFMIMFRQKIGGQLAVTVFNTLPQVIVGLVLVTFSFDIVGIAINMGNVLTNVFKTILSVSNPITIDGPLSVAEWFFSGTSVGATTGKLVGGGAFVAAVTGGVLAILGASGGTALPVILGAGLVIGVIGFIIGIAVAGLILFLSFKVYFTLLKAYIALLLDTILAPLYLGIAVVPGRSVMRDDWLRRIFKNGLVFPTVFLFLNLGTYLIESNTPISFPTGIGSGNIDIATAGNGLAWLVTRLAALYLMHVASEAPKILSDFFPQAAAGKGAMEAFQGAAKNAFGKIPLVGGMFS
ncbi:MAG: hypothetical protein Fur003_3640 [Candidatus Dojkabacteria bacterium]